jgi:hypothetical protein
MRKIWIPAVVALIAMGQQKPPAAPATTMPKYTMNSNLVIVDLTVKDKNGKAIEGLTKGDVEVFEDGKPQTSRSLRAAEAHARSRSRPSRRPRWKIRTRCPTRRRLLSPRPAKDKISITTSA